MVSLFAYSIPPLNYSNNLLVAFLSLTIAHFHPYYAISTNFVISASLSSHLLGFAWICLDFAQIRFHMYENKFCRAGEQNVHWTANGHEDSLYRSEWIQERLEIHRWEVEENDTTIFVLRREESIQRISCTDVRNIFVHNHILTCCKQFWYSSSW